MNPNQPPEQPPVFPVEAPQPAPQPAQFPQQASQPVLAKKMPRKKLIIIISSIVAAILLTAGIILAVVLSSRATPEDYAKAEASLATIKEQNNASREAYGALIFTATTEMTTPPEESADYDALRAYDRKKEVASESETLKTKTVALTETVNELKENRALKDATVAAKADSFIKTADAYILSSNQLIESSSAMGDIVTACLQPDVSLGGLLNTVLSGTDALVQDIGEITGDTNSQTYNPDTAVAKYDAKVQIKRCRAMLAANDKPLSHPTLDATRVFMSKALDFGRDQVVQYAEVYKSGGRAAGDKLFPKLEAANDTFYETSKKKISADQTTYVEGLDIEARVDELTPELTKAKQAL